VVVLNPREGAVVTETYQQFTLNPKIHASTFKLAN
jgi:hypothetical protein